MKNLVAVPSRRLMSSISSIPEFKNLAGLWSYNGGLEISKVREMMIYAQEIVRVNRIPKFVKARDALESIVSSYETEK